MTASSPSNSNTSKEQRSKIRPDLSHPHWLTVSWADNCAEVHQHVRVFSKSTRTSTVLSALAISPPTQVSAANAHNCSRDYAYKRSAAIPAPPPLASIPVWSSPSYKLPPVNLPTAWNLNSTSQEGQFAATTPPLTRRFKSYVPFSSLAFKTYAPRSSTTRSVIPAQNSSPCGTGFKPNESTMAKY